MKKLIISTIICFCSFANAGLLFPYSRLATKDLDQMNKLIQEKIKESKQSRGDRTIPLKEALQAIYSRPNEDFMIEKIIAPVKNELDELDGWEKSIKALVKESIGALKNPKAFKVTAQVTYAIFLENLIAEFKPKMNEEFEKGIITQIRDAKIEITKEALNERRLKMMKELRSPSEIAALALAAASTPAPTPEPTK